MATSTGRCESARPYEGAPEREALAADVLPSAAAAAAASLSARPVSNTTAAALDERLNTLLTLHGGPGIDVALAHPEQGSWSRRVGLAQATPERPVGLQTVFWWASIGKALTAAAALQAVEEGRLDLQDPLSRWVPDFPDARHIRVVHLLDHTNGSLSFNHPDAIGPDLDRRYQPPQSLLRVPQLRGNLSCPGQVFSYTNTGYLLLALVIEAVRAAPLHRVIEDRITAPLGLRRLQALPPGELSAQVQLDLAMAHVQGVPRPAPGLASLLGAGNVVGSAADMLVFWQALLSGQVLPLARVAQQFARLLPMGLAGLWYGLGVMVFDFIDARGTPRLWLGHSGGGQGANAMLLYDATRRTGAAVAVNGDTPASALALALIETLEAAA